MRTTVKPNAESQSERRRTRAEMRESSPAVVLSLVAFGIMVVVDPDGLTPLNIVWAVLWMASILGFVWVQVRSLPRPTSTSGCCASRPWPSGSRR